DQFFIQDLTGGIAVFWNGQGTNQPPLPAVGDRVEVVAPMSHFNGLQELNPFATNITHSVTVLSSGNPLPAAQPVPFDPTSQTNPVVMEALEGSLVVASNVTLSTASPYFSSS